MNAKVREVITKYERENGNTKILLNISRDVYEDLIKNEVILSGVGQNLYGLPFNIVEGNNIIEAVKYYR